MTTWASVGRLRLLLVAVIVAVVLGVVAMHQLASGHQAHLQMSPSGTAIVAMDGISGTSAESQSPHVTSAHGDGPMTATCVLLLVVPLLRPVRWAGAGHPIRRRPVVRRHSRITTDSPLVRARAPSRLQPAVCRT